MFSIQSLKIAIEIKQFLTGHQLAEVFAYAGEIISALDRDSNSFSPSFLTEIIATLLKVNYERTLELLIEIVAAYEKAGEVLARSLSLLARLNA